MKITEESAPDSTPEAGKIRGVGHLHPGRVSGKEWTAGYMSHQEFRKVLKSVEEESEGQNNGYQSTKESDVVLQMEERKKEEKKRNVIQEDSFTANVEDPSSIVRSGSNISTVSSQADYSIDAAKRKVRKRADQNGTLESVERNPMPDRWRQRPSDFRDTGRGSRWSINHLRRQFEDVQIEDLYIRYWLRLQRILLFKLLVVIIVYSVIWLILYNSIGGEAEKATDIWINTLLGSSLILAVVAAILVIWRSVFSKANLFIAILVWVFLLALQFAFAPFPSDTVTPMDNVPMAFYVIFVIHTMLPTPRRVAFTLSVITAILDLVLSGVLFETKFQDFKVRSLCANGVAYICAIVTGLYHKHLTDLAHRHTFLDTRSYIEADIRNARQRDRQTKTKEGLLLKIIPRHLLDDMKKVINRKLVEVVNVPSEVFHELLVETHEIVSERPSSNFKKVSAVEASLMRRPSGKFNSLFVVRNDTVSILYADIVNFTPLTQDLAPAELVRALNELFGRFDELAKMNECLRIKILGDCYYCVSGLPDPTPSHARNTVNMGMQMIKVIRMIREEAGLVNLDMRIGIHSGYVLSGVVGLKKWQYDVWSDDVTIANNMESGGLPGKVHITSDTLRELKGEFEVVEGHGQERNAYLKENNIQTYLIADSELDKVDIAFLTRMGSSRSRSRPRRTGALRRRMSVMEVVEGWGAELPFDSLSDELMERTMPEVQEVNRRLERGFHLDNSKEATDHSRWAIFDMEFSASVKRGSMDTEALPMQSAELQSQRLEAEALAIDVFTLRFLDANLEKSYVNKQDSSFKFYVACAFIIFLLMTFVQIIAFVDETVLVYICLGVGSAVFLSMLALTTGLKCLPFYDKLQGGCIKGFSDVSKHAISSMWWKLIIILTCCSTILVSSIMPMFDCARVNNAKTNKTLQPLEVAESEIQRKDLPCLFPPYYLYSCMLALIAASVFLRASYLHKMAYMVACLLVFNLMYYVVFDDVFLQYDNYIETDYISTSVRGTLYTSMLFVTLMVLDRQIDKNLRLDFLCKAKIISGKREVQNNEMLNELLLINILPRHAAHHFMNPKRNKDELYHQHCHGAAVMFAGIPNFKSFFADVDVSGKECLRLLNEIISAFDTMLIMRQYDGVEKIKTIGSTYMAAAGLTNNQLSGEQKEEEKNTVLLVNFAFAMSRKLKEISEDAFYDYKLKVGLCGGEVIAGVVGAQKPQYDIWGDSVNTASRMESNGVTGRIQVPKPTADILMKAGFTCESRGLHKIKGKGMMELFLVQEKVEENQILRSKDTSQFPIQIHRNTSTRQSRL